MNNPSIMWRRFGITALIAATSYGYWNGLQLNSPQFAPDSKGWRGPRSAPYASPSWRRKMEP
jgi:hypothetical protein